VPDYESIEIPLWGGLNTGDGGLQVEPPALIECTDFRLVHKKRWEKRTGAAFKGTLWSANAQPNAVFDHQESINVWMTDGVHQLDPVIGNDWNQTHAGVGVSPSDVKIVRSFQTMRRARNPDVAVATDGTVCVVWEEGQLGFSYGCVMHPSGETIWGPARLPDGIDYAPRVCATNGYFVVAGSDSDPDTAGGQIMTSVMNLSVTPYSWATALNVVSGSRIYDMHCASGASVCYLLTGTTAPTARINLINPASGVPPVTTVTATDNAVSVCHLGGVVYLLAYLGGTGYRLRSYNETTLVLASGPTTILATASFPGWLYLANKGSLRPRSSSTLLAQIGSAVGTQAGAGNDVIYGIYSMACNTSLSVIDSWAIPRGNLASHSALIGQHLPVFAIHNQFEHTDQQLYPAAYAVSLTKNDTDVAEYRCVSRMFENPTRGNNAIYANDALDWSGHTPNAVAAGDGRSIWMVATQSIYNPGQVPTGGTNGFGHGTGVWDGTILSRIILLNLNHIYADERTVVPTTSGVLLGGGLLGYYDGMFTSETTTTEAPMLPEADIMTIVADNPTPAYTYTHSIVLSWVDAHGKVHRSAPSQMHHASVAVDFSPVMLRFIPPTIWSLNRDNGARWQVEVYGSRVNGAVSEENSVATVRRLIGIYETAEVFGNEAVWEVDISGAVYGDANDQEYVQAGNLPSEPTLAVVDVSVTKDRVFYIPSTRDKVFFSKPLSPLFAPEFPSEFFIQLPTEGGDAVALATFDDKLIIFKERGIYVCPIGVGPDATGSGPSFPVPRRIPTDIGCVSTPSVVVTPEGAMFQGNKHIYLLDRNLQVRAVGAPVASRIDPSGFSYVVSSACLLPSRAEAIFSLRAVAIQSAGYALVYNYEHGVWYERTTAATATTWGGSGNVAWAGVTEDALVFVEYALDGFGDSYEYYLDTIDPGEDPRPQILAALSTGWIDLAGVQGFERFLSAEVAGMYYGGDFKVELYFDYHSTVRGTYYFRGSSFTVSAPYQVKCDAPAGYGKCRAVRIRVVHDDTYGSGGDVGPTDDTAGVTVEGMQIEVKRKATSNKNVGATFKAHNP
jgi:hypothetical protein